MLQLILLQTIQLVNQYIYYNSNKETIFYIQNISSSSPFHSPLWIIILLCMGTVGNSSNCDVVSSEQWISKQHQRRLMWFEIMHRISHCTSRLSAFVGFECFFVERNLYYYSCLNWSVLFPFKSWASLRTHIVLVLYLYSVSYLQQLPEPADHPHHKTSLHEKGVNPLGLSLTDVISNS